MLQIFAAVFTSLFLFWGVFVLSAAAATANHPVISQVQITGGTGKTANDFVELYNPTASDIDLEGYRLVKRTKTGTTDTLLKSWTSSAVIKAHGFYLWANSGFTDIAVPADAATSGTLADDNAVAIREGLNDTGVIIDSMAWGIAANVFAEGAVFAQNPKAGESLTRKPGAGQGHGEDTNNNSADFFLQTLASPRNSQSAVEPPLDLTPPAIPDDTSTSTLPALPTPAPSGYVGFPLEISEIFPNPKGRDSGAEWVELYNGSASLFDLSGWMLDDDSAKDEPQASAVVLDKGMTIAPFGYLVITIPKGKFSLNNSGNDAVRIFDDEEKLRLRQSYVGPAQEDQSFARDDSNQWRWNALPTPGAQNSFFAPRVFSRQIKISEVLPNPSGDDESEFIELANLGEEDVDLEDWVVGDKSRRYTISGENFFDTEVKAKGFFVLPREVTGLILNNEDEEEVTVYDPSGAIADRASFLAHGREGQSFARMNEGKFQWTQSLTQGKANAFLAEESLPVVADKEKNSAESNQNQAPQNNPSNTAQTQELKEEKVLGAATGRETLPRTGVQFWLILAVFAVTFALGWGFAAKLPAKNLP